MKQLIFSYAQIIIGGLASLWGFLFMISSYTPAKKMRGVVYDRAETEYLMLTIGLLILIVFLPIFIRGIIRYFNRPLINPPKEKLIPPA
jgi:hypothetical protein